MNMNQKLTLSGRVASVRVLHSDGSESNYGASENLVLNSFYTSGVDYTRLGVGTGTTTPSPTDTNLAAPLSGSPGTGQYTPTVTYTVTSAGVLIKATRLFTFEQGAVVGNLSEYGLTYSSDMTQAVYGTRALFKDSVGNPTTITVTSQDQLFITYEMSYIWKTGVLKTGTLTINGQSVGYTVRGVYNSSYYGMPSQLFRSMAESSNLNTIYYMMLSKTKMVTGLNSLATTISGEVNSAAAVTRQMSAATLTATTTLVVSPVNGNVTDFVSLAFTAGAPASQYASLLLELDTPISKNDTEQLTVKVGFMWVPGEDS